MFLAFITAAIRKAVLKGFEQAVNELQLQSDETTADPLAILQERMTPRPQIAAPEAESKARKTK